MGSQGLVTAIAVITASLRDHFGGKATHVLKVVCSDRRWVTERRFVTDF